MVYAGITDQAAYDAARAILLKMGVYFQAQVLIPPATSRRRCCAYHPRA